jgi:hypothetical protein
VLFSVASGRGPEQENASATATSTGTQIIKTRPNDETFFILHFDYNAAA